MHDFLTSPPAISSPVLCCQEWNDPFPGLPPKATSAQAGCLNWTGFSKDALAEAKSQGWYLSSCPRERKGSQPEGAGRPFSCLDSNLKSGVQGGGSSDCTTHLPCPDCPDKKTKTSFSKMSKATIYMYNESHHLHV